MIQSDNESIQFRSLLLLFIITTPATFLLFQGRLINHDTAWFLIAVERWIEGAELYKTIIEVNPPLNFYYTLPANWLSRLTGLTLIDAQYAVVSILIGVVLVWSFRILRAHDRASQLRQTIFMLMLWAALVVPALRHFAQRDHLLVIFLIPWAIASVFDQNGMNGRGGAIRGCFAALGICLKPHFLVFPLCVTLALIIRERSLRPLISSSNLSIFAMGAGYVAFVFVWHPAYFTEIVPMALLTYGEYGHSNRQVIFGIGLLQISFLFLVLLECLRQSSIPPGLGILAAMCLAGFASYILQWTGYRYQAVPLHSFGLILCAFLILRCSANAVIRSAILCALIISSLSIHRGFPGSVSAQSLHKVLIEGPFENGITVLSSYVHAGPILALKLQTNWDNRYPALWPVPGIVNARAETACLKQADDCKALILLAEETRQNVLDDLETGRPDAIVFDKKAGYFDEPGFSFETFLRRNDDISKFLDQYPVRVSTERFDVLYQ